MKRPLGLGRLALAALVACLCGSTGGGASRGGAARKPLDFLLERCVTPDWDDGIGGCLRDHLRVLLELLRPFITAGFTDGRDTVVLDPLLMAGFADPLRQPPAWRFSGLNVTGLRDVTLEEFALTKTTFEVKVRLPSLKAEGSVWLSFLPFVPRASMEVLSLRIIVYGEWGVDDGELRLDHVFGQFWSEGYSLTLIDVGSLPVWAPYFDKDD